MADSDALLVARVVTDDDRTAFELLVRRYQSPLRNFLRRLTPTDLERADDLAQETFLKLYTSIDTYKGTAKFSTWLYRIAYNTFLNDQRKRVPQAEFDETRHSAAADTALGASDEADIDGALRHLTDRQRAVFDLHYKKDARGGGRRAGVTARHGQVRFDARARQAQGDPRGLGERLRWTP